MKKELNYFEIEGSYGGNQDWMVDCMMNLGGCAALAACESCIYFDLYKETGGLYSFNKNVLSKQDYIAFSQEMKPYLKPRIGGIDRLEIFVRGFGRFLEKRGGEQIEMEEFSGERSVQEAMERVKDQIDKEFLIPCLTLRHKDPAMDDYVWHWFLLTGYEEYEDTFLVKAVTYGKWRWLDFKKLWNTGYRKKGGLILYRWGGPNA